MCLSSKLRPLTRIVTAQEYRLLIKDLRLLCASLFVIFFIITLAVAVRRPA